MQLIIDLRYIQMYFIIIIQQYSHYVWYHVIVIYNYNTCELIRN